MITTPTSDRGRAEAAERRAFWLACQFIWSTLILSWFVAAMSIDTEFARDGRMGPPFFAWVTEGSSRLVAALIVPAVLMLGLRAPLEPGRWRTSLPVHLLGFLAFTALHVTGMVLIREGVWAFAYGQSYDFFHDAPLREIVYEARKDLGTYIGYQIIFAVSLALQMRRLEAEVARAEARQTHRLTLKCGGRTLRIAADEFRAAQAAGNYVEIRLAGGEHLARSTLTELERQLGEAGIDAVRVHRSWLVNRDAIREIIPTGEGDVAITLDTGSQIPGSRRYRARLEAA